MKLVCTIAGITAFGCCWAGTPTPASAEPRFLRVLSYENETVRPVQAQRHAEPMPAEDLVATLTARGYREVSAPRRKAGYYIVEAVGRRGERLTLIVDVWNGEIAGLRRRFD
jgi:hypothetical protein